MKLALAAIFLAGCASIPESAVDHSVWVKVAEPLPMVWEQRNDINQACNVDLSVSPAVVGCMWRLKNSGNPYCLVQSMYSIEQAKLWRGRDGLTLLEHEQKHCDGYNHGVKHG